MLLDYTSQFGEKGTGNGQLGEPKDVALDPEGNVWVLDTDNHRVQEFKPEGKFVRMFGYGVLDGKEELEVCTSSCRAGIAGSGNGQLNEPKGMAIDSKGNFWISDQANNNVQEFNKEYKFVLKVTTANGKAFSAPQGVATDSKNDVWIADRPNDRIVELNESGGYVTQFGTGGTGNGQFKEPKGLAVGQAGNVWVADSFNARLEEFTSYGEYLGQYGSTGTGGGQFKEPRGIAVNSAGTMWVTDVTNNRVEQFQQGTPHDTKTIYYSTAANSEYGGCGEHPTLANLPCETLPATQPGTSGLPELPVTKYTYNIWDEPETTTETVGSTTRTKTDTYDGAGRVKTVAVSSTVGETLPTVTDEYNKETGALEKECANEGKPCTEGKPKTLTSVANKLGQIESYTDASENTTTYEYEKEKGARLKKIDDKQGTEAFEYNEASGLLNEMTYTNGATKLLFTGTYDIEGNTLTEGYPNGMTATYTYNTVGKPIALVYKKTTYCTEEEKEKCKWFKDTVIPSIHGQWLEQTSTFSHQTYTYDGAGRLTQVQNTPASKGCTTRIYAYDEDTNRTSLTTREPGTEGKCATTGGKLEAHTYDTADRLTDTGIAYNTFGDITTLPANDAEESAEHALTNTYYTDNQVASQTQSEQ
ncbi:MAG TPA: NHL repeat-containing protein, partial [Solirubrobacteraceae bacterium]|nr:NHL repeat-containing protein [Solirubrobacteraceae bacterium]